MIDPAVSLSEGLLRDVHLAGVLNWGDVHVAQKVSHLFAETDQRVQLGLALTVRAVREGSTCLDLDDVATARYVTDAEMAARLPSDIWPEPDGWLEALATSPLVTVGAGADGARPLRLVGRRLQLERYWGEETTVATALAARRGSDGGGIDGAGIDETRLRAARAELLSGDVDPEQAAATIVPLTNGVSVIAGGPGTGKTYTVARVLGMLSRLADRPLLIGLAAPTGKAAVRMDEALAGALAKMPADLRAELGGLRASTIHRLLGWVPEQRNRFRHDRDNPLPHDVVVVDEASMVSVTLMARLLDALRPDARLVLVGDPDQLSPVEAGAVLADIVAAGSPGSIARLVNNHRSNQELAGFAAAVLAGKRADVLAAAQAGSAGLSWSATAEASDLRARTVRIGTAMVTAALAGDAAAALARLAEHRVLCAHRHGPHGVSVWTRRIEDWIAAELPQVDFTQPWYPGRPVLVTTNSPDLGLFNGDAGVAVLVEGQLRVHFARGDRTQVVSPFLLDGEQTVYAMTVHKAQGSEFDEVSLVLPDADSPLLTRELLYTATTRARSRVHLVGSLDALAAAVENKAPRASGLRDRL